MLFRSIKQAIQGAIVDAGFIFGIDAGGTPAQKLYGLRVYLQTIAADTDSNGFTATFASTATNTPLSFTTGQIDDDWITVTAAATTGGGNALACSQSTPIWRGYIAAAGANKIKETLLSVTGSTVFNAANTGAYFEFEIEPCRVQDKARSYLRAITVANFERVRVPPCGADASTPSGPRRVSYTPCISGPITLEEGYNCQISQIDRSRTFTISARKDAGAKKDAAYCANNGEIPYSPNEEKPEGSKFYSGGPACDELLYTINGVGGRNVALIPGVGITISTENNKIVVGTQANLTSSCGQQNQDSNNAPQPN